MATKRARDTRKPRKKDRGEAMLCVTTTHPPDLRGSFPVEITFPNVSREEAARIKAALERAVRKLGYDAKWVPCGF